MTTVKPAKRRKRVKRVFNQLSEPLPQVEGTSWGPAMLALPSDRHRRFVLALYEIEPGWGCNAKAARIAGFGTTTSSIQSMASIGCRLAHDEKILAAIAEQDKLRIRASAPRAIRALQHVVENPDHRDHIRAVGMVLDRAHPLQTHHTVDVVHRVDHDAEAIAQLRMLKGLGVARAKLEEVFGFSGLSHYERSLEQADGKSPSPPLIEGRAEPVGASRT
jgi:phage terminase small subunit